MAKHKFQKALQRLSREIFNLFKRVSRQLMQWLLRSYLVLNRLRSAQAGFVLPTLALMMIVVFLVVAAVMFRTFSRNTQVIRDYQTQQVANAASPALDRAKAKIEFMFRAGAWPGNPPNEAALENIMGEDQYDFPGEERVTSQQLGLDSSVTPNVWRYTSDQNTPNDPSDDVTTIYGILFRTRREVGSVNYSISSQDGNPAYLSRDADKANRWLVRNGPLATTILNSNPSCNRAGSSGLVDEAGWVQGNGTATLYKNIQVYAVSIPTNNTTNKSISTVQYQQDRISERGNKWGAWFRYDLEAYPGQAVNWNGAMHSQGSIFLSSGSTGSFRSYLISSPSSCFFTPETSSKITAFWEVVAGRIRDNTNDAGTVNIDVQDKDVVTRGLASNGPVAFSNAIDSITPNPYPNVSNISTDPLRLQVKNETQPRIAPTANTWNHDQTFESDPAKLGSTSRVTVGANAITCAPYVDDLYRADNRLGPKPGYSRERQVRSPNEPPQCVQAFVPTQGTPITTSITATDRLGNTEVLSTNDLTRNDPTSPDLPETVGLDGYWERRARNEGLRIIVGQRLELGNPYGWLIDSDKLPTSAPPATINTVADLSNAGPDLSMFPPDDVPSPTWAGTTRRNEARQLRTLQDNLAAVQATAIYHNKVGDTAGTPINEGGYFPVACLASTVHPGTAHTLAESASFQTLQIGTTPANTPPTLLTDFFYGKGTNGWEFNPPARDEATFARLIDGNSALRTALENLADFAGDPNGAFPAPQDNIVHPYPNMTMWGNFSNLRQVMDALSRPNVNYNNLSIADKSYLHTAACTLGLLAYNISYVKEYSPPDPLPPSFSAVLDSARPTTIPNPNGATPLAVPQGSDPWPDEADYLISEFDRKLAEELAKTSPDPTIVRDFRTNAAIARILHLQSQIELDRTAGATPPTCLTGNLAKLCATKPKFPALYYLFPKTAHNEPQDPPAGTDPTITLPGTNTPVKLAVAHNRDDIIRVFNPRGNNLLSFTYQPLPDDPQLDNDIEAIALSPRELTTPGTRLELNQYPIPAQGNLATGNPWQLPYSRPNNGSNDNSCDTYPELNFTAQSTSNPPPQTNMLRLLPLSGTPNPPNQCVQVGFKDSAIFDGREMMSVRLFNLDLDLMRNRIVSGLDVAGGQQDTWLPISGLVYAFREDAVREDAILRPQLMPPNGYANYDVTPPTGVWPASNGNPSGASNIMNVWNNQDPPLINGISPKPIDYYPDPDRRSYGFRLRNGADLRRTATSFTVPTKYESRGLSLISDNPVYIQGNFNLHTDGSNTQEEFQPPLLANDYSNFYTRTNLNNNFARPAGDRWRTSEILADSITILSNAWTCDGTIQSGVSGNNLGCVDSSTLRSSYRNSNFNFAGITNLNLPSPAPSSPTLIENIPLGFICENPFDPRLASLNPPGSSTTRAAATNSTGNNRTGCDGSLKVFRNADIKYKATNTNTIASYGSFRAFSDKSGKESGLNRATPTTVNTILVSGVISTRPNGSNGGFHNFPRLLEDWNPNGTPQQLAIAGSMLQLNFSNYATGPYDQDAWEPPTVPGTADWFYYYRVPQRRWGYDTALQIAPPSPAAARLAEVPLSRSEFYREPPADDPYICKLRKVVETNLTCPT
ncbi:MAG TPA: hormogonium polysaccharide biosynthesis protein HpsA [Halomicronema sp.]